MDNLRGQCAEKRTSKACRLLDENPAGFIASFSWGYTASKFCARVKRSVREAAAGRAFRRGFVGVPARLI